MTTPDRTQQSRPLLGWLANQPYLLLSLTSLFWAGNVVLGRYVAGHVPPITLATLRWGGAFLLILPFALSHLKRDWPVIRANLPMLMLLAVTGIGAYNTIAYIGLQYTSALNGLLIQSSGPLFVAFWSFVLFRTRLTWAQALGIATSLAGVLTILARGDIEALSSIDFNKGDLIFAGALMIFCIYSALMPYRPRRLHALAFLAFTTGVGALVNVPFAIWEGLSGYTMSFDTETLATLAYVIVFPSTLAYLCYNRGVELIGANRSAPFYHLIPVFGSVLAIGLLGEEPRLFHLIGYGLVLLGVFVAARK
ncbi:DMT family transporter [Bradyrhizobium sp. LHD-71]|uniref:DMT family transporter n=1 Tax=Bradyrhizobium sp. LHD-71 TaxID=3072141 RepID=UPI00280F0545|nr:DMT family transporter [Bradyrhizobium sp. LHD-71]MDQ8729092.1 DMT family transporter [Bradyrhizobium sp. LHD-71]